MHLVRNYGVEEYTKDGGDISNPNPYEFCKYSNKAFKITQLRVLELLQHEQTIRNKLNKEYKTERSQRHSDKEKLKKIRKSIKLSSLRESLLKHVIDSIVWQIYGGKREIISRYYLEEEGKPSITDEGFKATLSLANEINEDPLKFALITDISENLQIGDLHIWSPEGIEIVEVKTGKKNKIAFDLFGFYDINNLDPTERIESISDKKLKNQMKRMLRQKDKMVKTHKILSEDKGEYPKNPESSVELVDSHYQQESYHHEVITAIEQSKEKGLGYRCVGGIIHIGAYRGDYRLGDGKDTLLKCTNGYPVYDIRNSIGLTISEPLFCKPFPQDMILDIITANVIVYIGIDLQKVIDFGNDFGGAFRWSTKRELNEARTLSPLKGRETIGFNNRGIIICETKNGIAFMGSGLLCRLVYDHLNPWIELSNRIVRCHKMNKSKEEE